MRREILLFGERGVVFPLMGLLIFGMIALIGLVVDIGRMEFIVRQAQTAADAAAMAGARRLDSGSVDDWAEVKRAVLAVLSEVKIHSLNADAIAALDPDADEGTRMKFTVGEATYHDCADYQKTTAEAGNISIRIRRKAFCYDDPSNTRYFCDLEAERHYCKANVVSLDLTIEGSGTYFATVFGVQTLRDIKVSAAGYYNENTTCGEDDCSDIGITDTSADPCTWSAGPTPCADTAPTCPP